MYTMYVYVYVPCIHALVCVHTRKVAHKFVTFESGSAESCAWGMCSKACQLGQMTGQMEHYLFGNTQKEKAKKSGKEGERERQTRSCDTFYVS